MCDWQIFFSLWMSLIGKNPFGSTCHSIINVMDAFSVTWISVKYWSLSGSLSIYHELYNWTHHMSASGNSYTKLKLLHLVVIQCLDGGYNWCIVLYGILFRALSYIHVRPLGKIIALCEWSRSSSNTYKKLYCCVYRHSVCVSHC